MSNIKPSLSIELNVDCPECDFHFDLVEDTDLNEEGWLLDQVLPNEAWIDAHENFKAEVICPECSVCFGVSGVEW